MKSLVIILLSALSLLAITNVYLQAEPSQTIKIDNLELINEFKNFQNTYNIHYSNQEEEAYRFQIFSQNYKQVQQTNNQNLSYKLGVNQLSHLTKEEFVALYLGFKPDNTTQRTLPNLKKISDAPTSIDWRTSGAVTPVKDQGQCGSCWAFSSTGSLEGANFLANKNLQAFSEQQLMDCSWLQGNLGCNGGLMPRAFTWVQSHGITTEDKYPYEAKSHLFRCKASSGEFKISSFQNIAVGDCDGLQQSVAQRPTSIAVDASNWQQYASGVFDNCQTSLDHGVLAVGYTPDYWIVKNSWNVSWGIQGYIHLKRGNTCGLCNSASYPVV